MDLDGNTRKELLVLAYDGAGTGRFQFRIGRDWDRLPPTLQVRHSPLHPTKDERVDAYIDKAKEFAKPILNHLRELVHGACPDVEETMKWSFPHFDYKGMMCSMAAFKEHCAFNLWKQSLLEQSAFPAEKTAMGSFGRITSLEDLPDGAARVGLMIIPHTWEHTTLHAAKVGDLLNVEVDVMAKYVERICQPYQKP